MKRNRKDRLDLWLAVAISGFAALVVASACGKDDKKENAKSGATGTKGDTPAGDGERVALSWDPPSDAADVVSYKIYVGGSSGKPKHLTTVETKDADFDADSPSVELEAEAEPLLEELIGEKACFTVTALDATGAESDASNKVCVDL